MHKPFGDKFPGIAQNRFSWSHSDGALFDPFYRLINLVVVVYEENVVCAVEQPRQCPESRGDCRDITAHCLQYRKRRFYAGSPMRDGEDVAIGEIVDFFNVRKVLDPDRAA